MDTLRLPAALETSQRILVAGAGGGFDVYTGLPIYERLRSMGKEVYLANLSFTALARTNAQRLTPALYLIKPTTSGEDAYFPERTLASFLSRRGSQVEVYAFDRAGVVPVRQAYEHLMKTLSLDAIVLVDGGTDILLRGDEISLGTPAEDMVSLAAAAALPLPTKIVTCVGFGIDTYHGVCHANWLENAAALAANGGFLGVAALLQSMPEVQLYLEAAIDADRNTPQRPSIVNGSICAAIEGRFGNYQTTARTASSNLFINPLMSLLWAFDLAAVAQQNLYLDRLNDTQTMRDVELAIEGFHATTQCRPQEPIPH